MEHEAAMEIAPRLTLPQAVCVQDQYESKPYHTFPFLLVQHSIYGKKPVYVPFFIENVVSMPPQKVGQSVQVPRLYRYVDRENHIDTLIPIRLRSPAMKTTFGLGLSKDDQQKAAAAAAAPKTEEQKKAARGLRYTLNLEFNTLAPPDTEEGAWWALHKDIDAYNEADLRKNADVWYPNVGQPDPENPNEKIVRMGSVKIPKVDYLQGLHKSITRDRVSTNQATGETRAYSPCIGLSVPEAKVKTGCFVPENDPVTGEPRNRCIEGTQIGRGAMVKCLISHPALYLMERQWGPRQVMEQALKVAEGGIMECVL